MEQIEAQGELLNEFAKRDESSEAERPSPRPEDSSSSDRLTSDQRTSIEDEFGKDSIESTFDPGRGRGKRGRARLVRLRDGRLVSVYEDPRGGAINVREIDPTRRGLRSRRGGGR
jgi:hypothetical protein